MSNSYCEIYCKTCPTVKSILFKEYMWQPGRSTTSTPILYKCKVMSEPHSQHPDFWTGCQPSPSWEGQDSQTCASQCLHCPAILRIMLNADLETTKSVNPPTRFGVHSLLFLCSIQNFVTRCPSKIPSPKSKIQNPQNPKSKIPKIQNPKSPKSKIQNPQIPKSKLCT